MISSIAIAWLYLELAGVHAISLSVDNSAYEFQTRKLVETPTSLWHHRRNVRNALLTRD